MVRQKKDANVRHHHLELSGCIACLWGEFLFVHTMDYLHDSYIYIYIHIVIIYICVCIIHIYIFL